MKKLTPENRALVERFMDAGCYRPTDTTFGFTEERLNELLNAARRKGMEAYCVDGPNAYLADEKTLASIHALSRFGLAERP